MNKFTDVLMSEKKKRKMSNTDIGNQCGVSRQAVEQFYARENPGILTVEKIAGIFGYELVLVKKPQ